MVSQEEVQFGIVPGLRDLTNDLAKAFARSREREQKTKLAQIRAATQSRTQAAAKLPSTKKADQLAQRTKRNVVELGEPGLAPQVKESKEGETSVSDLGQLETLLNQRVSGSLPTQGEGEVTLENIDDVQLLTPDQELTNLLAKNQRGETLNDDESFTLGRIQEITGFSDSLGQLADKAAKKGEIGQPIVEGVEFIQAGLQDGSITPTTANMNFKNAEGQSLPSFNQFLQFGLNSTDQANVAESQQTLTDLQNLPNPTQTDIARIDELQRVTAPPEFDEIDEIAAGFSQAAALNQQRNIDNNLLQQDASATVEAISGRPVNSESRFSIDQAVHDIETGILNQFQGDEQGATRARAQFRTDLGMHIKEGGSITTGIEQLVGANAGRAHRAQTIQSVLPAGKTLSKKFRDRVHSRVKSRAVAAGLTLAQSEFAGQAAVATQLPDSLITTIARMDKSTATNTLSQLRQGLSGATPGDAIKASDDQVKALAILLQVHGIGDTGVSQSSQQVASSIFQAFPGQNQAAPAAPQQDVNLDFFAP